jgi:transposase-like protein
MKFNTLIDLVKFFSTEEICHRFLKKIIWKDNKFCFFCNSHRIHEYKDFKRNRCYECKQTFSIRKGTIFDDSKISLQKWFMSIYLINSNKKGISSIALAEQIGVTQKTAWFMLQRIRNASNKNFSNKLLKDTVEIDEAYFGGKAKNMHMSKRIKKQGIYEKTTVLGMVERNNKVKAIKVQNAQANTLQREIYSNVQTDSIIVTDEHKAYNSISHFKYDHKVVNHSTGEYVRQDYITKRGEERKAFKIHTNTIEGYWAWVKRGVYGIHHWVSEKHIQKYLNDYSFKYNTKDLQNNERFVLFLESVGNGKLTYKQLVVK